MPQQALAFCDASPHIYDNGHAQAQRSWRGGMHGRRHCAANEVVLAPFTSLSSLEDFSLDPRLGLRR